MNHALTYGDLFWGTIIATGIFVIVSILIIVFGNYKK